MDSVLRSVDYLKELRIKREQDEKDGLVKYRITEKQFDKYFNDPKLNDYERVEMVKRKAEMMEERARKEEKLIKFGQGGEGRAEVEKTIAVNDMYIEAITAKLKILDQI
jgi:hypothetical protein